MSGYGAQGLLRPIIRVIGMKKGMAMIEVLVWILLGVTVIVVILPWFVDGARNFFGEIDDSEMREKFQACTGGATPDNDWDGDGLPNYCDPCVDVPNDVPMNDATRVDSETVLMYAYNEKYRDLTLEYFAVEDQDPDNPDNDGDGLPDICEQTITQHWAESNMRAYFTIPPSNSGRCWMITIKEPADDFDRVLSAGSGTLDINAALLGGDIPQF
jgi:hypothetical protein